MLQCYNSTPFQNISSSSRHGWKRMAVLGRCGWCTPKYMVQLKYLFDHLLG